MEVLGLVGIVLLFVVFFIVIAKISDIKTSVLTFALAIFITLWVLGVSILMAGENSWRCGGQSMSFPSTR